jgi:putative DNA primase/helicase
MITTRAIPATIRAEQQWAVRRAKVPYIAGTDEKARCNDPTTWRVFDEAKAAVEAGTGDGLYYALRTGSGIVGIDLDHCVTDGVVDPWAMVYVRLLNSYTCLSASGTGLRILVKGAKTSDRCKHGPVECYDHDRFLSITDRHVAGTPETIEERPAELAAFMQLAFPDPKPEPRPKASAKPAADLGGDRRFAAAMRDPLFERLHRGDIGGYPSPSEARMAYWFKAAFYTGGDRPLMRTWFETSSLDQRKLDRLGDGEMQKAIDGVGAFYDPDGGIDLTEGIAAIAEAEQIAKGEGDDLVCIPRSTYEQLQARAAEADRQQAVIQSQRATIAEYHTIQRQERELFASSLPPAQKLADWAILNVVAAKASRGDDEQPLYAEEVVQLCNVSRDTIGRRLEAQATLGIFTKTTKWDTTRLVVNEKTGEKRPPLVTRVKPLVETAEAWRIVAGAAASAPARKRAPSRCPAHPSAPVQRMCLAPVGERVCGLILSPEPMYAPTADVGVDEVPEILPQESAIHPGQRQRGYSVPLLPQESVIPEDLEPTVEDVLGGSDAPLPEPPEEPPDDETRERWRLEHYRERYDHSPSSSSPVNSSANGHHPPPPATEPLRMTPLEIIELLQAKYGPDAAGSGP